MSPSVPLEMELGITKYLSELFEILFILFHKWWVLLSSWIAL